MNGNNGIRRRGYVGILFLTLHLLTACGAHYHIVPAGKVDFKECDAGVETMIPWNGLSYGDVETWTVNGPELENMLFHLGIEDGKNLASSMGGESNVKMPKPMEMFRLFPDQVEEIFNLPRSLVKIPLSRTLSGKAPDGDLFRFRKAMTASDIMMLFAATFGSITRAHISTSDLRATELGGRPGFRFDYAFTGRDGVYRKGLAVGAVVDGKLYLIHYYGAELYYFEKHRIDAEKVIGTFRFKKE